MKSVNIIKNISKLLLFLLAFLCLIINIKCDTQLGPDPWNLPNKDPENSMQNDMDTPHDLKIYPKKNVQPASNQGSGDWFFKRILNIVLKGGQIKRNKDGSVDISLQMNLHQLQWETLEKYMKSNSALTEDMYRRSVGYLEHAIYKPTITDHLLTAWSDYVMIYFIEYKVYIAWTMSIIGLAGTTLLLWEQMSQKHFLIILFVMLYAYEVFISYKEAEQLELDRFLAALSTCRWSFWRSSCDVPKPDPLIFIKHMNPLKIGIRMFTTVISEPMVTLSHTLKTMVQGITDGLWYPLDVVVYSTLIIVFNLILLLMVIMIIFNFILNIPFNLNFLFGLVSVGVKQHERAIISSNADTTKTETIKVKVQIETLTNETIDRFVDIFTRSVSTAQRSNTSRPQQNTIESSVGIRRSASAGRLSDLKNSSSIATRRNVSRTARLDGTGDAH